jgi:hypothetical protein
MSYSIAEIREKSRIIDPTVREGRTQAPLERSGRFGVCWLTPTVLVISTPALPDRRIYDVAARNAHSTSNSESVNTSSGTWKFRATVFGPIGRLFG